MPVELPQVPQVVKLLSRGHLAGTKAAGAEPDRRFADREAAAYHELQRDLVSDRPARTRVGQPGPACGKETAHRVGAANRGPRQQSRDPRVENPPRAPARVHETSRRVAATDGHVAAGVQGDEKVRGCVSGHPTGRRP